MLKFHSLVKLRNISLLFAFILIFTFTMPRGELDNYLTRFRSSNLKLTQTRQRIFCFVLTQPKAFDQRARISFDFWVRECDGHYYMSVIPSELMLKQDQKQQQQQDTVKPLNSSRRLLVLEDNMRVLQPSGYLTENYKTLTDKIFKSFIDVHREVDANEYDWYFKADDDTVVFMDNLREFLSKKNPNELVTYGYNYRAVVERGYQSGGAGYVMGARAFGMLASALDKDYTFCKNTGIEDIG